MTFKIAFLEAAKRDIDGAVGWYESRQKGLGLKFLSEVGNSLQLLESMPKAFPHKYENLRVKLISSFPYALFYRIESENRVRIYACIHLSRNLSEILKER